MRTLGVTSGVGEGIVASSTGLLLKTIGLAVTSIKIDPYINEPQSQPGPGMLFIHRIARHMPRAVSGLRRGRRRKTDRLPL